MRIEDLLKFEIQELHGVEIEGEIEIQILGAIPKLVRKLEEYQLLKSKFEPSPFEWKSQIQQVRLGSTKEHGGTRSKEVILGGYKSLGLTQHRNLPALALDCFDLPIPLPRPIRDQLGDLIQNPVEWARYNQKLGADLITLHLLSTDPGTKDASPAQAAKLVEELLQQIRIPLIIGGTGNTQKDPLVFQAAAQAAHGERCLLSTVNLGMDYQSVVKAALEYDHCILALTNIDINQQRLLNRHLLNAGLTRDRLVMDPMTAALGYGLDYSFSNMERIRLAGLRGDPELNFPISAAAANAMGAREAWMRSSPIAQDWDWGSRQVRCLLWESITALAMGIAGADLLMITNPQTFQLLRSIFQLMISKPSLRIQDWITLS